MNNLTLYDTQRIVRTDNEQKIQVCKPNDLYELEQIKEIKDKVQEHFLVVTLNTKNIINSIEIIGIGSLDSVNINITDVLRSAIIRGSNSIILVHNHPSGNNTPSRLDIEFTNRLNSVAKIFNIQLLDHIIVADENLSMMEKGYINENCSLYTIDSEKSISKKYKEECRKFMRNVVEEEYDEDLGI